MLTGHSIPEVRVPLHCTLRSGHPFSPPSLLSPRALPPPTLSSAIYNSNTDGGAAPRPSLALRQVFAQRLAIALQPGCVQPDGLEGLLDAALGARVRVLLEELIHLGGALL